MDRSKKRDLIWKKAIIHFSICFVMGFFTGFTPSSTGNIFSGRSAMYKSSRVPEFSQETIENLNKSMGSLEASFEPVTATTVDTDEPEPEPAPVYSAPPKLLIVVTTTRLNDPFHPSLLRRLGHTLRLVPPPLLWIVVESHLEAQKTAETLRMTGIMYRHLVFKENFTDPEAEIDHQRNAALNHIEHHRLNGIVYFSDLSNVYDLQFFEEIQEIEEFGAWPVATVFKNQKRVAIEGPVCNSSRVLGWHLKDPSNIINGRRSSEKTFPRISLSIFAFNSSILWDPERWGRSSSVPDDSSQDPIKFVQEVVLEDETKLMPIPPDCSRILAWHLHLPTTLFIGHSVQPGPNQNLNLNQREGENN